MFGWFRFEALGDYVGRCWLIAAMSFLVPSSPPILTPCPSLLCPGTSRQAVSHAGSLFSAYLDAGQVPLPWQAVLLSRAAAHLIKFPLLSAGPATYAAAIPDARVTDAQ